MLRQIIATGCVAVFFAGPAFAGEATVTINKISSDGIGAAIGTVILKDGHHNLKFTPELHDLPNITAGTDGRGCTVMAPTTPERRRAAGRVMPVMSSRNMRQWGSPAGRYRVSI